MHCIGTLVQLCVLWCHVFQQVVSMKRMTADTMPQGKLLRHYGYPYENHTIITDKGVYLAVGRIPYRATLQCPKRKGVVLASHGIFNSGDTYICLGKNLSLGLILHDRCYDVWLFNMRGTRYPSLLVDTSSREYWNHTMEDVAYDLGVAVQYILSKTAEASLHAIGFSIGTTLWMIHLSLNPALQREIKSMHLMAPIAYTNKIVKVPDWLPRRFLYDIATYASRLTTFPTQDRHYCYKSVVNRLCRNSTSPTCSLVSGLLAKENKIDPNTDPYQQMISSGYFPDRLSMKLLLHLGQTHITGNLTKWDYGPDENLELYGSTKPPLYPLENIQVPTYLYYSNQDLFAVSESVEMLARRLPNVRLKYHMQNRNLTHSDFASSFKAATRDLHKILINAIDSYR